MMNKLSRSHRILNQSPGAGIYIASENDSNSDLPPCVDSEYNSCKS